PSPQYRVQAAGDGSPALATRYSVLTTSLWRHAEEGHQVSIARIGAGIIEQRSPDIDRQQYVLLAISFLQPLERLVFFPQRSIQSADQERLSVRDMCNLSVGMNLRFQERFATGAIENAGEPGVGFDVLFG